MSALVATRTLTLKGKQGEAAVEVHQLNGLQLFDYQQALLCVEWPSPDGIIDPREQQQTLLRIHRLTFEMNLLLAAQGLHYLHPELDIEQMKARVLASYPDPAHVLRLAMAVKELSGLATLAAEAEEAKRDEPAEPIDPKKG